VLLKSRIIDVAGKLPPILTDATPTDRRADSDPPNGTSAKAGDHSVDASPADAGIILNETTSASVTARHRSRMAVVRQRTRSQRARDAFVVTGLAAAACGLVATLVFVMNR
jgi:hypothetical protein